MARMRLNVRVQEPWNFDRANGTSDLAGWTASHNQHAHEDWIVYLDAPFTIDDEAFEAVRIWPRYHGETMDRVVEDRLVNVSVNIVPHGRPWADMEERPLTMAGTIAQGWGDPPAAGADKQQQD